MNKLITSIALAYSTQAQADQWATLQQGIESWAALNFDQDFAVNVGNANGTIWTYSTPDFSMSKTRMAGASLSKWPAAIMISGLVADGTMSYDDPVNKYLKYWATDEKDVRSKVTLRDLLTFTSGYTKDSYTLCRKGFAECA